MTPLEFLAVVLPSPGMGLYCAAGFKEKIKCPCYKLIYLKLLS